MADRSVRRYTVPWRISATREYGACVWCDPERWIPEAARLLRPGGRLVFLTNSVQAMLCVPEEGGHAGERLLRPQRGTSRLQWPGGGVEFHPGHGEWIRVLTANGFAVDALHELYARDGTPDHAYYDVATADWARRSRGSGSTAWRRSHGWLRREC